MQIAGADGVGMGAEPLLLDDAVCEALVRKGPAVFDSVGLFKSVLSDLADQSNPAVSVLIKNCDDALLGNLRLLLSNDAAVTYNQFDRAVQKTSQYLMNVAHINDELAHVTSGLVVTGVNKYLLRTGGTTCHFDYVYSPPTPEPEPVRYPTPEPEPVRPLTQDSDTHSPRPWIVALVALAAIALIAIAILVAMLMHNDGEQGTATTLNTDGPVEIESVTLDMDSVELEEGGTVTLRATVRPSGSETVLWSSSSESVASVDNGGKVTGLNMGTATITATAGGQFDVCEVTVKKKSVKSVILSTDAIDLDLGDSVSITATVDPAGSGTVSWSSSNDSIATVDQSGRVTAVGEGVTTVNASAGGQTATCKVSVKGAKVEPSPYETLAASFAREWSGSFIGINDKGEEEWQDMHLSFSQVGEDGHVRAMCIINSIESDQSNNGGSYIVEGDIDWESREINLWWESWVNQGTLGRKRRYIGTFNASFNTITGSCESTSGNNATAWQMSAD